MVIGVFIGVLAGLCLALAVALIPEQDPDHHSLAKDKASRTRQEHGRQDAAQSSSLPSRRLSQHRLQASGSAPAGKPTEPKTRLDFLHDPARQGRGGTGQGREPRSCRWGSTSRVVYYLQAGAFQKASDAGQPEGAAGAGRLEAQIQTATLPDNSIWHRVRLGPL